VFWKRFGTGVPGAASGTEHEIREAYGAWQQSGQPQIMVYFNHQKPTDLSPEEEAQWQAVRRFQADPMFKEGLWWSFENTSHFEKLVRMHLTQYLKHRVTPIECNVRTVETPIGTVDVSHPRPVKPQSLEAIAPALRRHRNTNLGFEIAWPKSGWLVIDDAVRLSMMKSMVSARAGMANPMPLEFALVLLSELDYGVFRPNVNVLAERLAPMTIGDYVDRSKIVMGQAGLQVEGSDHDDATNSGVIVFYGRDPDGRPLFQFQRVLLGSGVALIATASQLPPMNQVGERMRTELAAILNSFRRV
jgi:hypothetical protein